MNELVSAILFYPLIGYILFEGSYYLFLLIKEVKKYE